MNEIIEKAQIEVSNRHVHLSVEDSGILFGKEKKLTSFKKLSQLGQFAANEVITLINKDKMIKFVRVVGPERKESQVELSKTDARYLGMDVPIRLSGDIENTPGITIKGTNGEIKLKKGVIVPQRHLHCSPEESKKLRIENGQDISISVSGIRSAILNKVRVRVHPNFRLAIHLDTDEANTLDIKKKNIGFFKIK